MEEFSELKSARLLSIYARLLNGRLLKKALLAQEFGVSARSIQRDLESLRSFLSNEMLPQDVVYDRAAGGYRLTHARPMGLSNSEILAVCKILLESRSMRRDEMLPILDKLVDCCVPEENKRAVQQMIGNEKLHYIEPHHGQPVLRGLWELGQAVQQRQVLELDYQRLRGAEIVRRTVEPVGILFSEYYFYLAAYTRWWWFGCAVDKDEIERELDCMLEAGIGGVELQILYPIVADNQKAGIRNQNYLSPEFFSYIRFAAEAAKKRGMKFDMTLGSSWPYGGPFVPVELSAPNVIPYTIDVKGPCKFSYDFTTRVYGDCVACVVGKMQNCEMLPESIVDITNKVVDKYLFNWKWGTELETIDIPEGDHKIVIFVSNEKRQTVLKPLPGGDGLIIDHNRKDALRLFLEHGGNPIAEKAGDLIQSFFCDSIEVFGQNWTDIIYDEFRKRRGYELRPYIYALWGEVKGMTDLVRYDFQKTLGELTVENFFQELTKWCHEKGATSRIQAHGTWGDILMAYGAADIPEGETFSAWDRYEVNTIHRKLASSAGHLYHKPIISNESFTWLRFPRFTVTPEILKAAADSIFLDGMNQIVNHGYAYSPENTGKLGWPFYASTQLNHKNTWWPFYKYMGTYFNRVCDFMRRGKTKIRLAVYLPQADIWAENPMSDIHMAMKLEERLTTELVDGIHKADYWFDYINNDDALSRWDTYEYEALVLLECDRIPVETARSIQDFAKAGRKVICKGHAPLRSCGLLGFEKNSEKVAGIFKSLCEAGLCTVTEDSLVGVTQALDAQVHRDVVLTFHSDKIGFVHQVDGDTDIYFLSNISTDYCREKLVFCGQTQNFSVFDPMTADEKKVTTVEVCKEETTVELTFAPFQSLLFVFAPGMEPVRPEAQPKERVLLELNESWTLRVPEMSFEKAHAQPVSWEQEPELKYYSGEGIYETAFELSDADWQALQRAQAAELDFGRLCEAADIYVNEAFAGALFMRPYKLDVLPLLRCGRNTLEIRVRNLLINCAIDPSCQQEDYPEPVIEEWPYTTGKSNQVRKERVYNWRECDMIKEPVKSGICGKVQLIAVER